MFSWIGSLQVVKTFDRDGAVRDRTRLQDVTMRVGAPVRTVMEATSS